VAPVIKTYGLTHLALAVRDVRRASTFYRQVFGAVEVYKNDGFVQLQTPGSHDVLVFEKRKKGAGVSGGIAHFGFRLQDAKDIDAAARAVTKAGGRIVEQGEFVPGEPYLFATDPDGYVIEIWYELPTPVDPRPRKHENTNPESTKSRKRETTEARKHENTKTKNTQTTAFALTEGDRARRKRAGRRAKASAERE
jgi:catechol 2,3-dioxygenase-like lactoylglutathione lyase family enzyme